MTAKINSDNRHRPENEALTIRANRINQDIRMKTKRTLFLCTIYPDEFTDEMIYNHRMLSKGDRLTVKPVFVKAGHFSHRHARHEPDPVQIKVRQMYLDHADKDEWLLVIDSDELLLCSPNRMADYLDYLDANDMDVGFVYELLPNGEHKGRPQLIKNREGLKYGGPSQKHDVIWYCDVEFDNPLDTALHQEAHKQIEAGNLTHCPNGYNYIDVDNETTAMELPIRIFHVKNGVGLDFFVPKKYEGRLKHPEWVMEVEMEV